MKSAISSYYFVKGGTALLTAMIKRICYKFNLLSISFGAILKLSLVDV